MTYDQHVLQMLGRCLLGDKIANSRGVSIHGEVSGIEHWYLEAIECDLQELIIEDYAVKRALRNASVASLDNWHH